MRREGEEEGENGCREEGEEGGEEKVEKGGEEGGEEEGEEEKIKEIFHTQQKQFSKKQLKKIQEHAEKSRRLPLRS